MSERPISIAILALGGQGGGVLTRWLVDTAEANGYLAQSTFVAGVAQRTGATVYCVEMFPQKSAEAMGRAPIFTPYPVPGDVDLVIAGEMAETGRAIQKGFVTPQTTTLIASSHRTYSIDEKSALGDGILDQSPVAEVAERVARRFVCFDMEAIAKESNSIISSVLLGAVAGSGALPFERAAFEQTIRRQGTAVEKNLAGFSAGYERTTKGSLSVAGASVQSMTVPVGTQATELAERVRQLPEVLQATALTAVIRVLEYQDRQYADFYLDRVQMLVDADRAAGGEARNFALSADALRQLALQMAYEDTIRVAELKTRPGRIEKIRQHVAAEANQPVHIIEYFHPRIDELCDTLPFSLGSWVHRSPRLQKCLAPLFRKGRNITTSNISGFLTLRLLAKLKRFRRNSYRYSVQQTFIERWLKELKLALAEDYNTATAISAAIGIVKGYGDTYARGMSRFVRTLDATAAVPVTERAAVIRQLHQAALTDDEGRLFDSSIGEIRQST